MIKNVFLSVILGSNWASTAVMYSADHITWKTCSLGDGKCRTAAEEKNCGMLGGACRPYIDAYYLEVGITTLFGIFWLIWKYRAMMRLQALPISAWQVSRDGEKEKPLSAME